MALFCWVLIASGCIATHMSHMWNATISGTGVVSGISLRRWISNEFVTQICKCHHIFSFLYT